MKHFILTVLIVGLMTSVSMAGPTFTLNKSALSILWQSYENPIDSPQPGNIYLIGKTTDASPPLYPSPMDGEVGYVLQLGGNGFTQIQIGANFWGTSATGSGANTADVIAAATGVAKTGNIEIDNDLTGYDAFSLTFTNDNQSDWQVNMYMNTGYTDFGEDDNYYQNSWTLLSAGQSVTLTLDLTGLGLNNAETWTNGTHMGYTAPVNLNHVTNIGFNVAGNMGGGGNNPSVNDTSHISVSPIPAPGAILLGSIGVGLVGWLRRRRTL